MTQRNPKQMIVDYLYDELSTREREEFEQCLAKDTDLAKEVDALLQMRKVIRDADSAEPSLSVTDALIEQARQAVQSRSQVKGLDRFLNFFAPLLYKPAVGIAATAVLVIGVSLVAYQLGDWNAPETPAGDLARFERRHSLLAKEEMAHEPAKTEAVVPEDTRKAPRSAVAARARRSTVQPAPGSTGGKRRLAKKMPMVASKALSGKTQDVMTQRERKIGRTAAKTIDAEKREVAAGAAAAAPPPDKMVESFGLAESISESTDEDSVEDSSAADIARGREAVKRGDCRAALTAFDDAVRDEPRWAAIVVSELGRCRKSAIAWGDDYPKLMKHLRAAGLKGGSNSQTK